MGYFSGEVERMVRAGLPPEEIHLDITVATLRDETPHWLLLAYDHVSVNKDLIKKPGPVARLVNGIYPMNV